MRVIILSSLVAVCIAIASYYVFGGMSLDTAAALSGASVRL
tara:strand:+ start:248 stop:370 length:123 start_codon:yes stop_codon:yes gene_type:complete